MRKQILIVAELYPPSVGSSSKIMQDLAVYLCDKKGFDVKVITTSSDRIKELSYQKKFPKIKIFRHLALFNKRSNYLLRGLFNIASLFSMLLTALTRTKPDIVFVYSPPLVYGIVGVVLKYLKGSRFILNVQDLFPKNAIDLGILKEGIILNIFQALEKFLYSKADLITAHSESNARIIEDNLTLNNSKLIVAHNWIDFNNDLSSKNIADHKPKKIIFGGVLGPSQIGGIIDFLKAFKRFSENDYILDIYGEGSNRKDLEIFLESHRFKNVNLFNFLSSEEYDKKLFNYHIGLVCLSKEVKTPVVPGKILGYMKSKLSCIAIANKDNDLHGMINSAGCGLSSDFDLKKIEENLEQMLNMNTSNLGENGYQYAKKYLVVDKVVDDILKELHRVEGI